MAIPKSGYVHIKTFKSKALSYKVAVTLFCTMVPGWEDISIKLCVVKLQQKNLYLLTHIDEKLTVLGKALHLNNCDLKSGYW